jgi:putative Mn2+ efflux pump MntP
VTALLLIAVALGVDNLAVSIGIGMSGVRGGLRLRVALVFGLFEAGMPVLGMLAGHAAATSLGGAARWTGGGLLIAVGCYQVAGWYRARRSDRVGHSDRSGSDSEPRSWGIGRLLASGLALSMDNLVVGFALGAYHVTLATAAVVIAVVSVAMSLAGLELGARAGAAFGDRGVLAGGIALTAVGILMAAGVFLRAGRYWPTGRAGAAGYRLRRGRIRRL